MPAAPTTQATATPPAPQAAPTTQATATPPAPPAAAVCNGAAYNCATHPPAPAAQGFGVQGLPLRAARKWFEAKQPTSSHAQQRKWFEAKQPTSAYAQ